MDKKALQAYLLMSVAALLCAASAHADTPSVSVSLNLTTGHQQQSASSTTLPSVPVPIFNLRVPFKRFALTAEGSPPIGPVQYGDGSGGTQSTKLDYLSGELTWHTPDDAFEIGTGTTLVNQVTAYNNHFPLVEQASRVAGFRISVRWRIENTHSVWTDFAFAASPSMHGLQRSKIAIPVPCPFSCPVSYVYEADPELASLIDLAFTRTNRLAHLQISYGLRYMNYAARFQVNGAQADRELLLMPFVGLQVPIGH